MTGCSRVVGSTVVWDQADDPAIRASRARLGFGYLPHEVLVEALDALSNAMDQALA
jgi:hypothetical protein